MTEHAGAGAAHQTDSAKRPERGTPSDNPTPVDRARSRLILSPRLQRLWLGAWTVAATLAIIIAVRSTDVLGDSNWVATSYHVDGIPPEVWEGWLVMSCIWLLAAGRFTRQIVMCLPWSTPRGGAFWQGQLRSRTCTLTQTNAGTVVTMSGLSRCAEESEPNMHRAQQEGPYRRTGASTAASSDVSLAASEDSVRPLLRWALIGSFPLALLIPIHPFINAPWGDVLAVGGLVALGLLLMVVALGAIADVGTLVIAGEGLHPRGHGGAWIPWASVSRIDRHGAAIRAHVQGLRHPVAMRFRGRIAGVPLAELVESLLRSQWDAGLARAAATRASHGSSPAQASGARGVGSPSVKGSRGRCAFLVPSASLRYVLIFSFGILAVVGECLVVLAYARGLRGWHASHPGLILLIPWSAWIGYGIVQAVARLWVAPFGAAKPPLWSASARGLTYVLEPSLWGTTFRIRAEPVAAADRQPPLPREDSGEQITICWGRGERLRRVQKPLLWLGIMGASGGCMMILLVVFLFLLPMMVAVGIVVVLVLPSFVVPILAMLVGLDIQCLTISHRGFRVGGAGARHCHWRELVEVRREGNVLRLVVGAGGRARTSSLVFDERVGGVPLVELMEELFTFMLHTSSQVATNAPPSGEIAGAQSESMGTIREPTTVNVPQ